MEEISPLETPQKQTRKNIVTGILFVVIFIFLGGIWFLYGQQIVFSPNENTTASSTLSLGGILQNGKYSFPKNNFEFMVTQNWEEIPVQNLSLPKEMSGAQFALKKKNTSCVLAYIYTTPKSIESGNGIYPQTSFEKFYGGREGFVYTIDNEQLSSSWHLHRSMLPQGFQFRWQGRQPFPGEVRIIHYPRELNMVEKGLSSAFILYSDKGEEVPQDCSDDVSRMISTLEQKFEIVTLDKNSKGKLFLKGMFQQNDRLFFISDIDSTLKLVSVFLEGSVYGGTLYDNKILYVEKSSLKMFDVFSKETTTFLSAPVKNTDSIIDFSIYKNKIFYLLDDSNCADYMGRCSAAFYEYDIKQKKSTLLAENISARDIEGYDPQTNAFYLRYSDGDAGMVWGAIYAYSFDSKKVQQKTKYGGGEGSDGQLEESWEGEITSRAEYTAIEKRFENPYLQDEYILISNGELHLATTTTERMYGRSFREYVDVSAN